METKRNWYVTWYDPVGDRREDYFVGCSITVRDEMLWLHNADGVVACYYDWYNVVMDVENVNGNS